MGITVRKVVTKINELVTVVAQNPCAGKCSCDCNCLKCPPGPQGPAGETGAAGPQGPAGGVLNNADFYALMPPDNAATVAPGTDVSFPQDGPNSGSDISRTGPACYCPSRHYADRIIFAGKLNFQTKAHFTWNVPLLGVLWHKAAKGQYEMIYRCAI